MLVRDVGTCTLKEEAMIPHIDKDVIIFILQMKDATVSYAHGESGHFLSVEFLCQLCKMQWTLS
jgi:hypothetical protein